MNVQLETAVLAGLMVGVAVWLILHRGFVRILFGFLLLSNAVNLGILSVSGDPSARSAPIVDPGAAPAVDPLPQALILTAIVIGFGVLAYLVFLFYRLFVDNDAADLESLGAAPARRDGKEEVR